MLKTDNIIVPSNIKNIIVENYVIGYSSEGESVVVFLKQDDEIIYSMVIDSFSTNVNRTAELLEKNNVKNIDVLCWTHPHEDHSKGIELIIEKYCKSNTKIIIPNIDNTKINDIPVNCRKLYESISKINKKGQHKYGSLIYGVTNLNIRSGNLFWNNQNIDFNLFCISPNSIAISNNKYNKNININDFSVSIIMEINNQIFIYGGDMENSAINYLLNNNCIFDNVVFIKAPHHGSNSTSKIFDIINLDNCATCAITNYVNGNIFLPELEIVNGYKNMTQEVYLFNKEIDDCDYGILENRYIIESAEYAEYEIITEGTTYNYI